MTDEMDETAKLDKEFFYMWLHRLQKITRNWDWDEDILWNFLEKIDIVVPASVLYIWGLEPMVLWEYKDEADFTKNFLMEFFRELWYSDVKYTHWMKEYWKDIVMRIQDKLWNWRYIWVQAKAWNVSGSSQWIVDTLITQVKDWFTMDIPDFDSKWKVYMSEFIVVTNWKFTDNATDKILQKITDNAMKNNVYFMDSAKIESKLSEVINK
jgi:hypothetical protein